MAANPNLFAIHFNMVITIMMDAMSLTVRKRGFAIALALLLLALIIPCTLTAQRGGARGSRSGPPTNSGTNPSPGPANPAGPDLTDFNRAVALQATSYQTQQFRTFVESTEVAEKIIRTLLKISETATHTSDYSSQAHDLDFAIDEILAQNDRFFAGLSKQQRAGLKVLTKKLRKSGSEVTKHFQTIDTGLGTPLVDGKQLTGDLESLNAALTRFKEEQLKIGEEMGIPAPAK